MIETFKEFHFEAAHDMTPWPGGLHGHTFKVQVVFTGPADPVWGWAVSLTEVDERVEVVRRMLDHKCLNDIIAAPSLENVAKFIFDKIAEALPCIDRVTVRRGLEGHGEGCTFRGRA
jgi:6-pyruvoyltetrahydropterin/6-carboxytetrahydropterin synthase